MKRFIYFTFVVLSTLALSSACSDSKEVDGKPDVTVTFDSQGGSAVASITVEQGAKITKPTDPTKEGEIFAGWFKEQAATTAWDFQNNVVEANITLYAKWVSPAEVFTVTFETNGGSTIAPIEVTSGAKVTRPADPIKEGFTLENWYSNAALTTAYNFATPVTANLTLYAKWTEATNAERQALTDLLGKTYGINTADYTAESVAVLAEAQAAAQNVVDNFSAPASEILAAHAALQEAFDALVPIRGNEVVGLVIRCANLIDGVVYISPNQYISVQAYAIDATGASIPGPASNVTFEYDATQVAKWGVSTDSPVGFSLETKKEALEPGSTALTIRSVGNPDISQTVTLQTAGGGVLKQIFLDMVAALPEPAAISYDDYAALQQAQSTFGLLSITEQADAAVVAANQKINDCFNVLNNLPKRLIFSAFTDNICNLSEYDFSGVTIAPIGEFTYTAAGAFPAGTFVQNNTQESYGQFTQNQYTINADGTGTKEYRTVENAAGDNPSKWFPENNGMIEVTYDGSQTEGGTIYYKIKPW